MRIIDISQELLNCNVYPGDPIPEKIQICSMEKGDLYNLSGFSMCAHNGTHVDAPAHFVNGGETIDNILLDRVVGPCYVARMAGDIGAAEARQILSDAESNGAKDRILIAGDITVTEDASKVFANAGIKLLGNESQTVGPEDAPMGVHLILLNANVVLLEGIVLDKVNQGTYWLSAAPINICGAEGAPVRAYLVEI